MRGWGGHIFSSALPHPQTNRNFCGRWKIILKDPLLMSDFPESDYFVRFEFSPISLSQTHHWEPAVGPVIDQALNVDTRCVCVCPLGALLGEMDMEANGCSNTRYYSKEGLLDTELVLVTCLLPTAV